MNRPLNRLAWLALLIVDEAAEAALDGPLAPTPGLRLALAYLHSIADGPLFELPSRRYIFDEFWRTVTGPDTGSNPYSAAYARNAMTESCLQQIGRQIGQHAALFNSVRDFRKRGGDEALRLPLSRVPP